VDYWTEDPEESWEFLTLDELDGRVRQSLALHEPSLRRLEGMERSGEPSKLTWGVILGIIILVAYLFFAVLGALAA
jgi:hypothetical protein